VLTDVADVPEFVASSPEPPEPRVGVGVGFAAPVVPTSASELELGPGTSVLVSVKEGNSQILSVAVTTLYTVLHPRLSQP
jgi:hypothetical protein